jgi:hypothetical protein
MLHYVKTSNRSRDIRNGQTIPITNKFPVTDHKQYPLPIGFFNIEKSYRILFVTGIIYGLLLLTQNQHLAPSTQQAERS